MEVLKNTHSPIDAQRFKTILPANKRNFVGGLFPANGGFNNLSGQLLADYNNCLAAHATYIAAQQKYQDYQTALSTYEMTVSEMGCSGLVAPPQPTLETRATGNTPCDELANQKVDKINGSLTTQYNTALADYNAKKAACTGVSIPNPVSPPSAFNVLDHFVAGDALMSGADGSRKQFKNACGPCALLALAADGEQAVPDIAGTKPSLLTLLMIAGATILAYKIFIKD